MSRNGAVPPHDLVLERGVLGQLLQFGSLADQFLAASLTSEDFYRDAHRRVFRAITRVMAMGAEPDLVNVGHELGRDRDEVGAAYFSALVDGVPRPSAQNIVDVVHRLRDLDARRVLQAMMTKQAALLGSTTLQQDFVEQHIAAVHAVLARTHTHQASPFLTVADVLDASGAQPTWIIPGYVASGSITDLAGAPKAAGKTTLLMHMVRCLLDRRPFLDRPVVRTPVVYLTEENVNSLAQALGRANIGRDAADLVILPHGKVTVMPWPSIMRLAVDEARRIDAHVVVVDTLPQFAGLAGDEENSAGAALEAARPLRNAATQGLAVVVGRHERKGGGRVGESARGSSAWIGAVDIVLALQRPEGHQRSTVRVLSSLSRFDETPTALMIEKTDHGFVSLGDERDIATAEAERALLERLSQCENAAILQPELLEAVQPEVKRTTALNALRRLMDRGVVLRRGKGRKGDPYWVWKVVSDAQDV